MKKIMNQVLLHKCKKCISVFEPYLYEMGKHSAKAFPYLQTNNGATLEDIAVIKNRWEHEDVWIKEKK